MSVATVCVKAFVELLRLLSDSVLVFVVSEEGSQSWFNRLLRDR